MSHSIPFNPSFLLQEVMRQNAIGFVLNASHTCPQPPFIADAHFLRVPVNDSFCEKILPWLDRSLDFIGGWLLRLLLLLLLLFYLLLILLFHTLLVLGIFPLHLLLLLILSDVPQ